MIEEQGTVVSCDGEYAQVSAGRRKACGGCQQSEGCSTSLLASVFGSRDVTIRALNPVDARPGERVILGIPEQTLVGSAFLLYGAPLLGFLLCAIVGNALAVKLGFVAWSDAFAIGAGLAGLFTSLILVRVRSCRMAGDPASQTVILRRDHEIGGMMVNLR